MTEQNKELFIEFVNFCESQPEDKYIDHSTWDSCAVGEFAEYKGIDISDGIDDSIFASEIFGSSELRSRVGNGFCPSIYGEFTKFLKQYL